MSLYQKIGYHVSLMISFIFLFSERALAQNEYLAYNEPGAVNSPNLFWELTKVILALAFVIGVAYFLLQLLNKRNIVQSKNELGSIIGNINIAPGRMISFLAIGEKVMVLGVTENSISYLADIDDPEILEKAKALQNAPAFSEQLTDAVSRLTPNIRSDRNEQVRNANVSDEYNNLQNYFQEQLKKMRAGEQNDSREGKQ